MKVSSEWLQEYLGAPKLDVIKQAEALEQAGIEVEQIISSKVLDKNIVVGVVKKVIQHPDADRLKLCQVNDGKSTVGVVCGAPNVKEGMIIALAKPKSILPDGTLIEAATIRGQRSEGMICSAAELGVSDDHSGVLELSADYKPGQKLCELWPANDVIDVKTHANRPDLQSVVGLAREIAAISGSALKQPEYAVVSGQGEPLAVKVTARELVPRYMVIDLIVDADKPSPDWLKGRLAASGVRPINLVVDITNYVMLEMGQPLHAFDATKVKLPITVRLAKAGEKLQTLDAVERKLNARDLVIADAKGPIALAGVMGGASSQITENTRRIILESATFDGANVRKTAVRHGLRTDASARFERRLPVQLAPLALDRAAALLIELAGAKPSASVADHLQIWPWVQHIGARPSRLSELFGAELSAEIIADSLHRLGFIAEPFDVLLEAKKHLGKPYVWGAKYRTHGTEAFDCSYLIDYIYSLIGLNVGHTALGQWEHGRPVHTGELAPGDVLFYEGLIDKSATDHYYVKDEAGKHVKQQLKGPKRVGHNGIYIGDNKVIDVRRYIRDGDDWKLLPDAQQVVQTVPLETYTSDPGYLGARRYVENLADYVAITVPWWRPDVKTETDILEEVARMVGYDKLPATLPAYRPTKPNPDSRWPRIWQTRAALLGLGLFEVVTYSFVSEKQLADFGYDATKHLKLKNPLSSEQAYLRSELLPSLVSVVQRNRNYADDFGIFELSRVYKAKNGDSLPDEPTHLGVASRLGYQGAKAALDLLGRELRLEFELKPRKLLGLQTGRSAQVWIGSHLAGVIGEVNSQILEGHKIGGQLGYLELNFDLLLVHAGQLRYRPISKFPSLRRDLSLLAKQDVTWAQVKAAIVSTGLASPHFLSDYYGPELPAGTKTIAVGLEMSDMERTLTDKDAEKRLAEITKVLERKLGAKPRE